MPLIGPTRIVRWLAGYDLAGAGALTEFEDTLEGPTADTTVLGPLGAIKSEAPLGRAVYTATETGFIDDVEYSLRRLFASAVPAVPWRSVVGHFGSGRGAPCTLATDLRIKKKSIPTEQANFTKVALEYFLAQGGQVYQDAIFLHAACGSPGMRPRPPTHPSGTTTARQRPAARSSR